MATVAVQIVTYNSAATIERCIRSALAQEGVDTEIMVVDNASTDDTARRVEAMGLAVVTNRENRGYAAAHNQALALSDSPYVLTLNPDARLAADFLKHLVQALDADSRIGSASGCLLRLDDFDAEPRVVDSAGLFMRRSRRQGLRDEGRSISQRPQESTWIFGPDGAAAFYRRAMLEDIADHGEVFDEDFFMHKEDVDVCWRARSRGWRSRYVPDAIGYHIRSFRPRQRAEVDRQMRFYGVRNRYLLLLKNERLAACWKDIPFILLYDLGVFGYMLFRERELLRALTSAWRLRKRMLAKRKFIMTRRSANCGDGIGADVDK